MKWMTVTIFYKKPTHLITLTYSICPRFQAYIKGKQKRTFSQMHVTSLQSISTGIPVLNALVTEECRVIWYLFPFRLLLWSFRQQRQQKKNSLDKTMHPCTTMSEVYKFAIHGCANAPQCAYWKTWCNRLRHKSLSYLDQDMVPHFLWGLWSYLLRTAWAYINTILIWCGVVQSLCCDALLCLCLLKQPAEQPDWWTPSILDAKCVKNNQFFTL